MTHHLLEKQELSGVIVGHHHLMVSKCFPESMSGHLDVEVKVFGDTLENSVYRVPMDRLVLGATMVGLTSEHIVTQIRRLGEALKVCDDSLFNCSVNGDMTIPLVLPGVAGLLFKDREAGLEALTVFIDEMSEAELPQVTHSQSKVDANDEEHIVTEAPIVQ